MIETALPSLPDNASSARALDSWLTCLSIALHKRRAYPTGHPSLAGASEALQAATTTLLAERADVLIGIAQGIVSLDGVGRDAGNAIIRELTERLHRRRVAAIHLRGRCTADELAQLLTHLDAAAAEPLDTPGVTVIRQSFSSLGLADSGADAAPESDRWAALLAAALRADVPTADGDAPATPPHAQLAAAIAARRGEQAFLRTAARHVAALVQASDPRVQLLLDSLDATSRAALTAAAREQGTVAAQADGADVESVLAWVEEAAQSAGQSVSTYLLRLLRKLATLDAATPDADSAGDMQEVAKALVSQWSLQDPNPESHAALLEHVAQYAPRETPAAPAGIPLESLRLLQLALELGLDGNPLERPTRRLIDEGALATLVETLQQGEGLPGLKPFEALLLEDASIRALLLEEPIDHAAARLLLARCSVARAPALIDVLAISESSATRTVIMEALRSYGAAAAPAIVDRLQFAPWYVQRNLLALLAELPEVPAALPLEEMLRDPHAAVRVEALKLALRVPALRTQAFEQALADDDDRPVRLALEHLALQAVPDSMTRALLRVLGTPPRAADVRLRAIRLLPLAGSSAARDWLLERTTRRTRLLRRLTLRTVDSELIASLAALADRWADDPLVAPVLQLARDSDDAVLRKALTRPGAP